MAVQEPETIAVSVGVLTKNWPFIKALVDSSAGLYFTMAWSAQQEKICCGT